MILIANPGLILTMVRLAFPDCVRKYMLQGTKDKIPSYYLNINIKNKKEI